MGSLQDRDRTRNALHDQDTERFLKQSNNPGNENELAGFDESKSQQLHKLAVTFSTNCDDVLFVSDRNKQGIDVADCVADIGVITEELPGKDDINDTEDVVCLEVDVPVEKLEITVQEGAVIVVNGSEFQKNGEQIFKSSTYQGEINKLEVKKEAEEARNCSELCEYQVHSSQIDCMIAQPTQPGQRISFVGKLHPTTKRSADESLNLLKSNGESKYLGTSWFHQVLNASDRSSNGKDYTPTGTKVNSQEEKDLNSLRHSFPILQPRRSLGLAVKEKHSTASFCQPFTDAQQCQLRTQILVYGALIEGTLPGESLMGVAFADISNETRIESWESYIRRSQEKWEKIWQKAAQKMHKTVSATGGLSHARVLNRPSTLLSRSKSKTPTDFTHGKTSPVTISSIETGLFDAFMPDAKSDKVSSSKIQFLKRPHPAHITSPASSAGLTQKLYASSCSPSSWVVPSRTLPATKRLQEVRPHLNHWQVRSRNHPYTQTSLFQGTSSPWLFPYASGHNVPPCARVVPLSSEVIYTEKAIPASLNGRSVCQYPPVSPASLPVLHSYSSKVVAASGENAAGEHIHILGNGRSGARRLTKAESQWKKRKTPRLVEGTKESLAQPASSKPSIMTDLSKRSVLADRRSVSNCTLPSTSVRTCDEDEIPVNFQDRIENACSSRETLPPITNVAPVSAYVYANGQLISQKETIAERPFLQGKGNPLEQAKLNAHEALTMAALAVQHSQLTRCQPRKSSSGKGLQLACSTAAVAAAASVAKAAAAAAKLAYETAVQANSMVSVTTEEKLARIVEPRSSIPNSEDGWIVNELGENLSEHWQISRSCNSVISLAKASVRKQIESAAATTRRAQNLDALVQAAELAVGAAVQAGAVIGTGEPASLTPKTLLEVGLGRIWKMKATILQKKTTCKALSSRRKMNLSIDSLNYNNVKITAKKHKRVHKTRRNQEAKPPNRDNQVLQTKEQKGSGGRGCKKSQSPKKLKEFSFSRTAQLPSLSDGISAAVPLFMERMQAELNSENEIVKGSVVEVVPDEEGFQGVWFSAKVLSIDGNQALVVYDELLADDGNSQLKEWVPLLSSRKQDPPRVRPAHPMIKDEASRRRRRSAMGNQMWRVGDHVDAWMRDGWWEGIVTSISNEHESKVTVFFPGDGDIDVIKSWNLRPSLVWRDGRWVIYKELTLGPSAEGWRSSSTGPSMYKQQRNQDLLPISSLQERKSLHEYATVSHAVGRSIDVNMIITKKAITPLSSPLSRKKQSSPEFMTGPTKLNAINKLKRKSSVKMVGNNIVAASEKTGTVMEQPIAGGTKDGGHSSSSEVSSEKLAYVIENAVRTPPSLPLCPKPWTETETAQKDTDKRSENHFAKMLEEPTCDTETTFSVSFVSGNSISPLFHSQKRPTPEVRKRKYQKQNPKTTTDMKIDGKQPFAKVSSTKLDNRKTRRSIMQDSLLYTNKQVQMYTINANDLHDRYSEAIKARRKRGRIIQFTQYATLTS